MIEDNGGIRARLLTFLRRTEGVAAVEFALIAPFMLVLLVGMVEVTEGLNYDRKVSQVASSIADLVSQSESVSNSDLQDVVKAAESIMQPYSTTPLKVVVASVSFDSKSKAKIEWVYGNKGTSGWPKCGAPPITIPTGMATANTTIVVGQSEYTYTPLLAGIAQNIFPRAASIDLSDIYYLRPRLSASVANTSVSACS